MKLKLSLLSAFICLGVLAFAQKKCKPDWEETDPITGDYSAEIRFRPIVNPIQFSTIFSKENGFAFEVQVNFQGQKKFNTGINDTLFIRFENGTL